jgi:hypothetical protein
VADQGPVAVGVRTAQAALVPVDITDGAVDAVLAWTTGSLDRHRMGDRLMDLRASRGRMHRARARGCAWPRRAPR